MVFNVVQIVYWLALSAWFGAVLFLSVAWRVIVRTLRERDPILPDVLSVNLEGQHGTMLAGEVLGNLQDALVRIEFGCAAAMLLAIIGQWFVTDRYGSNLFAMMLRSLLFIAAVIFLIYDWRGIWPRIRHHRQEFIDHADEPELANKEREMLDYYHHQGVNVLTILFMLLLGLILFSGGIVPAPQILPGQAVSH